jgi:hypothetical protein
MARKEIVIDIQDREQLLTFKIREMSATRLEDWISRALLLLGGSAAGRANGTDVYTAGSFLLNKGLTALAGLDYEKARPLLDELLGCCSRMVERVEERCTRDSADAYILDVKTLFRLRMEAARLNLGFLPPEGGKLFNSPSAPATETPLASGKASVPNLLTSLV